MDIIDFISNHVMLVVFAGIGVYWLYKKYSPYQGRYIRQTGHNSPLLNSFYTDGKELAPMTKGKFGELDYIFFVTKDSSVSKNRAEFSSTGVGELVGTVADNQDKENTVICCVTLPFTSATHLVGLSRNGSRTIDLRSFIKSRGMEEIVLEGNFPEYAYIYASPGNQLNSRYVMDPGAMQFVADFCINHHWEIIGNYLYFVASGSIKSQSKRKDSTFMNEDVEGFVKEIKPALVREQSAS